MKIELKRTSEDFSQKIQLGEAPADLKLQAEGVEFDKPVKVELTVSKSKDQLICRGKITAPVNLECSRCLLRFEEEQSADLDFVIDLSGTLERTNSEEDSFFVADPSSSYFVLEIFMIPDLIKVNSIPAYIHSRTGMMPSLWRVKRWVKAGWIPLVRSPHEDNRFKWTTKSLVDKFISEHKEKPPEPKDVIVTFGRRDK